MRSLPIGTKTTDPVDTLDGNAQVTHVLVHKGVEEGYITRKCWAIFLQISETESFRLDLYSSTNGENYRGPLRISPECFVPTPDATLTFPVLKPTTIRGIVFLINSKRHAAYRFRDRPHAARFWVYTMIADMQSLRIVESGSSGKTWDRLENDHLYIWPPGFKLFVKHAN